MQENLDTNDMKSKLQGVMDSIATRYVDERWVYLMALFAILMIATPVWLKLQDVSGRSAANEARSAGQNTVTRLLQVSTGIQNILNDQSVQDMGKQALADPEKAEKLKQHIIGLNNAVTDAILISPNLEQFDPVAEGENGFALFDMLLAAEAGKNPPLQLHSILQPPMMVDLVALETEGKIEGYLSISISPDHLLSQFNPNNVKFDYISLSQNNGRQVATVLAQESDPGSSTKFTEKLLVSGTLFRIELPQVLYTEFLSSIALMITISLGLIMLLISVFLLKKSKQWGIENAKVLEVEAFAAMAKAEQKENARNLLAPQSKNKPDEPDSDFDRESGSEQSGDASPPDLPEPPPMRLRYDIGQTGQDRSSELDPVELTSQIFRAYDIRGVVGKSLDAGVAEQVGKVLGTLALEQDAGPVVVARDGRMSGPGLVDGMIRGIVSTGCNVMNVGAVPTGVLYYAAHEHASGTGVMITGSHNPPDYNGFKVMVAGHTLFGDQISDIYRRIVDDNVRKSEGEGQVEELDILPKYIDRISSDIKLDRSLKVVIDCGNGIGGVCAADVLREVGADAYPLFDEVDGTFPNHHPDPSDPENLIDLIEAVRFMDADIGLALDGDADRLGVVTRNGDIIYSDRIMMLLAKDVLSRVPGATIIYDVKCTGHLATVIEEAGGNPVMYKTGHSLIKARMKEIGSPFGGEMSGHFFFGERWYGVDDGIYAAARLLEILSASEASPTEILNALPTSFSTPELKVHMEEGETHAFVDNFQAQARFEGAKVTAIDGVRADYPDGWGLVRASNTTPILVVRFDAETEEALERIKTVFRAKMLTVNPDLDLPF